MDFTVFYAWQSDRPAKVNRDFIECALTKAIEGIRAAAPQDESSPRPQLDKDTQGVPGAPGISETIRQKIRNSGVFVGDLTLVGETDATRAGGRAKLTPNPNVLLELGWASASIGWERVIMVMNTAHGGPEQLPSDVRHRECAILYELTEDSQDALSVCDNVAKKLAEKIRLIANDSLAKTQAERREKQECEQRRAQQTRDDFEKRLCDGKFNGFKVSPGVVAVSIIPESAVRVDLADGKLRSAKLPTIYDYPPNHRENRADALVAVLRRDDDDYRFCVTELNSTGAILAADCFLIATGDVRKLQQRINQNIRGAMHCRSEERLIKFVHSCTKLLRSVGVTGSMRVCISLLNVRGFVLERPDTREFQHARANLIRVLAQDDIKPAPVLVADGAMTADLPSVAKAMKPAFDHIWRDFGYDEGSANYDKQDNWKYDLA